MWQPIEGFDGNLYYRYFHHLGDRSQSDKVLEDVFKRHLLLEMLDYLKVLTYVKDYDGCYEIILKARL